jgi:hypothetical protein
MTRIAPKLAIPSASDATNDTPRRAGHVERSSAVGLEALLRDLEYVTDAMDGARFFEASEPPASGRRGGADRPCRVRRAAPPVRSRLPPQRSWVKESVKFSIIERNPPTEDRCTS